MMTRIAERQQSVNDILEQTGRAMFPGEPVAIDVRTKDHDGDTALHLAALAGDEQAVRELLRAGAFVDELDANRRSPLYYAALKGHVAVVGPLLAAGANPDLTMELGLSPRVIAQRHRDQSLLQLFGD